MQRILFAATIAVAMAACSHGGFDYTTTRTIPSQTIPGDATAHQLALSNPSVAAQTFSLQTRTAEAATATPGVTWVALTNLQLAITPPSDGSPAPCWDFVRTMTVSVESTKQGSALPRIAIATTSNPACTQTVALTVDPNVDLGPYANEGFSLQVEATGIPPAQNVTFDGTYQLTLSVL